MWWLILTSLNPTHVILIGLIIGHVMLPGLSHVTGLIYSHVILLPAGLQSVVDVEILKGVPASKL